jgi:Glutamate-cysteine ligase family 2(GCS2)
VTSLAPLEGLRCGIESEFALVHKERGWSDFTSMSFEDAQRVVDRLPDHHDADLTRGDLAIKMSRWYVEGDERFDLGGGFLRCVPKGIETRTPIQPGINAAVASLVAQTADLAASAAQDGYRLASIGYNPYEPAYRPDPPYNDWEQAMRAGKPEYLAPEVYMLSYGPDLNVSHPGWDGRRSVDIARKLAYYTPVIVPFSFSSPFRGGERWPGYSVRTAARAGQRPAVRVFLERPSHAYPSQADPTPVWRARIPPEVGRIEFKAFDAVPELADYTALLALVVGLAMDESLPGRADNADPDALRRSARSAFHDEEIYAGARSALTAATAALTGTPYAELLAPLHTALGARRTPAHPMIERSSATASIPLPLVEGV